MIIIIVLIIKKWKTIEVLNNNVNILLGMTKSHWSVKMRTIFWIFVCIQNVIIPGLLLIPWNNIVICRRGWIQTPSGYPYKQVYPKMITFPDFQGSYLTLSSHLAHAKWSTKRSNFGKKKKLTILLNFILNICK